MSRKTDGGQGWHSVKGHLFASGSKKWKYEVSLDYTDSRYEGAIEAEVMGFIRFRDGFYVDPVREAWLALKRATERGTSDVSITDSQNGYFFLVVIDPPGGYPVMAEAPADIVSPYREDRQL